MPSQFSSQSASQLPDQPVRPLDHLAQSGRDGDPALILRSGTITYQGLRSRIAALSGWLAAQVPEPGARVASWAAKGELTCLLPLAAARAGLVHVPVNPLLKRAQVAHILADSGTRLLIGSPARLSTLQPNDIAGVYRVLGDADALAEANAAEGPLLPPSAADPASLA
ncbi:MAG TPA: AMP-binding protein, partial [Novosphingobium sp.]